MSQQVPWLRFDEGLPDDEQLVRITECLAEGRLIILPTDTVYGVAADERTAEGEAALFEAKQRPAHLLLPRLVANVAQIEAHGAVVSDAVITLAERFWPGPLTLVLPHPTLGSIGYRIPQDPVTLAVLGAVGYPLLVTSANISGEPEAVTADEAWEALSASVSLVLDAGPAPSKVPSSVVRMTGETPEILREGGIKLQDILDTLHG